MYRIEASSREQQGVILGQYILTKRDSTQLYFFQDIEGLPRTEDRFMPYSPQKAVDVIRHERFFRHERVVVFADILDDVPLAARCDENQYYQQMLLEFSERFTG